MGQEVRQRMACLCSAMSWASAEKAQSPTMIVGGRSHLQIQSLACLVPGLGGLRHLDSGLEYLHVASICSLGFLTAWRLRHSGTC